MNTSPAPVPPAKTISAFAGIDGGGTQTSVAIIDASGHLLSTGHAGPSNSSAVGVERAFSAIRTALREAADRLPSAIAITHVHAALAGAGAPEQQQFLRPLLTAVLADLRVEQPARWPSPTCTLSHDAAAVLAANHLTGGIVLIAGTGSFVWGQDDTGHSVRYGGWGYLLGDPASGFDLGRRALCAVLSTAEGDGPSTALTKLLLAAFHCHSVHALIPHLYRSDDPRAALAGLAQLVIETATAGDPVARHIVYDAAAALARQVTVVYRQLHVHKPTIILSGAVAKHPFMAQALHTFLDTVLVHCTWQYPQRPPAEGAAYLALRHAIARAPE
ncbi:MAG: hypothetical protein M1298_01840 [Chloroflexi bacterium]|nr:hypothetical protein [Chloroflexota bacterium]